jgi:hypothetical protein
MIAGAGAAALLVGLAAGPAAAKKVPPDEWADSVCSATLDWAEALDEAGQAYDEAETPEDAADALDDAVADTRTLIKAGRRAGTPDVDGGKASARAFIAVFKDARGILEDARAEAADLPEDSSDFEDGKTEIDEGLDEGFTDLDPDIQAVRTDADSELQDALDDDSACREIFGTESDEQ